MISISSPSIAITELVNSVASVAVVRFLNVTIPPMISAAVISYSAVGATATVTSPLGIVNESSLPVRVKSTDLSPHVTVMLFLLTL